MDELQLRGTGEVLTWQQLFGSKKTHQEPQSPLQAIMWLKEATIKDARPSPLGDSRSLPEF